MFFFSLLVFMLAGWFLPWWALMIAAMAIGITAPVTLNRGMHVFLAGALAWAALAYILDGRSYGTISSRMAGVFGLPSSGLMFVLMAAIGGVTAALGFQTGLFIKRQLSSAKRQFPSN
jgi:hypothetical protein